MKPLEDATIKETVPVHDAVSVSEGFSASLTEESEIIELMTANATKSYLKTCIKKNKIASYGNVSDYPRHGVVYILFSDYHGVVRKHVKCVDGVPVDLKTGSTVDILELLNQNSAKYSVWFTFK